MEKPPYFISITSITALKRSEDQKENQKRSNVPRMYKKTSASRGREKCFNVK